MLYPEGLTDDDGLLQHTAEAYSRPKQLLYKDTWHQRKPPKIQL